mgnify:CR=1 FL=1
MPRTSENPRPVLVHGARTRYGRLLLGALGAPLDQARLELLDDDTAERYADALRSAGRALKAGLGG